MPNGGMETTSLEASLTNRRIRYTGNGKAVLFLYLKSTFLLGITLGLYAFWLAAEFAAYNAQNTEAFGQPFTHTGTGKERLIRALKGFAWFFLPILTIGLLVEAFAGPKGADTFMAVVMGPWLLLALGVWSYHRYVYRVQHLAWGEHTFSFHGDRNTYLRNFLKGAVFTALTAGIYGAWWRTSSKAYRYENTELRRARFAYTATGAAYFKVFAVGLLLTLVSAGIYAPWWRAALLRFDAEHTAYNGQRFESELQGKTLFLTYFKAAMLTNFTVGIGAPWAYTMIKKAELDAYRIRSASASAETVETAASWGTPLTA